MGWCNQRLPEYVPQQASSRPHFIDAGGDALPVACLMACLASLKAA
jgi:hypothetical protein